MADLIPILDEAKKEFPRIEHVHGTPVVTEEFLVAEWFLKWFGSKE